MIIGLTGTYCAGKNFVSEILEKHGLPVLDVDKLGHKVIETEKNAILETFGNDILNKDGVINRKILGEKVFGNADKLAALEAIIHPAVNRETEAWIREQKGSCVINAALLHRSSAFSELGAVILVRAPFLTRLIRAKKRDHLPWRDLIKRLRSQKLFTSQYSTVKADIYRVENPGCFGFFPGRTGKKTKARIEEILSFLGL